MYIKVERERERERERARDGGIENVCGWVCSGEKWV